MPEPVYIATPSRTLLSRVRAMVPPLLEKFHKGKHPAHLIKHSINANSHTGKMGRVAVIGGSAEYVLSINNSSRVCC